ncbi:MAG: hypothetical protein M1333_02580, partial [Patescibacteria group bacterium]|nr:hypothetical protein [Patescibacteria group bacterium]
MAVDSQGRDLFDLGDGVGLICGNPRPVSYKFPPPSPPPSPPVVVRKEPPPEPGPTPLPPPKVEEPQHTCPTCQMTIDVHTKTKTIKFTAKASEGYLSGTWSIDGHEIGKGATLLVSHDRLLKLAGKGEHEIVFKAVDGQGHEVICKGSVALQQGKKGRFWLFRLPGLNCLYAWTVDIGNWKLVGTIEKLGCLALGYGIYSSLPGGAVANAKEWIPGRPAAQ